MRIFLEHVYPGKEARETMAQVLKRVRRSGAQVRLPPNQVIMCCAMTLDIFAMLYIPLRFADGATC